MVDNLKRLEEKKQKLQVDYNKMLFTSWKKKLLWLKLQGIQNDIKIELLKKKYQ